MPEGLILLVDDEANILNLARLYLEREGYLVLTAEAGQKGYELANQRKPDLVVLDVMLPGLDGFEICRKLRAEGNPVPIIMLTARDEDIDKVLGLELGADDYLTKPFNPRELVARVKAILRRSSRNASPVEGHNDVLRVGDLEIDCSRREVLCGNTLLDLRTQEFEVLWQLALHRGLVLTRERLLQLAWGYDYPGQTRTVDMHIAQLRRKLKDSRVSIETITGIGYKLVA
ncbi:MAG: response regulator transcription factor [Chloroflexi bacterium]|nr:response regulator transcription factor [Chloroflexota bacterium]